MCSRAGARPRERRGHPQPCSRRTSRLFGRRACATRRACRCRASWHARGLPGCQGSGLCVDARAEHPLRGCRAGHASADRPRSWAWRLRSRIRAACLAHSLPVKRMPGCRCRMRQCFCACAGRPCSHVSIMRCRGQRRRQRTFLLRDRVPGLPLRGMRRWLRRLSRCQGGGRRWRWRRLCADRQRLRPCRLQHPAPHRSGRRTQRCALPGHWQARPARRGRRAHAGRRALTVHKEAHQQRPGGAYSRGRPRAALRQARWQRAHLRLPARDARRQRVLSVPRALQCRRAARHPLNNTATVSGPMT